MDPAALTPQRRVSDFLTVQSFANFAAMTGAITATWAALRGVWPWASSRWVPYILGIVWAIISFLISWDGLKEDPAAKFPKLGTALQAGFVAFINGLVLAGAVVGTNNVVGITP